MSPLSNPIENVDLPRLPRERFTVSCNAALKWTSAREEFLLSCQRSRPLCLRALCPALLASLLYAQPGRRVLPEQLPGPDVTAQRGHRAVAGLTHDHQFPDSVHRRLRHVSRAQAVAGHLPGFYPGTPGGALENRPDRVPVEPARRELSVAVDGAEDRTRLEPGLFEPAAQGFDCAGLRIFSAGNGNFAAGPLLVGLGCGKFDDHSFGGELQVGYLDVRQLGPAEGARETDQRERPVAQA